MTPSSDKIKTILLSYVVPAILLCSVIANIALIVVIALGYGKPNKPAYDDNDVRHTNRSASLRAGDPAAIYWGRFEPTRTARLSIPYKNFRILVYEPAPSVTELNLISGRKDLFYYTPAAILNASSAVHSNNKFANKYQVEFNIVMWDADYVAHIKKEISERLDIPNPKVRIIPIEEVRIDVASPDWSKDYEVDNNWRPFSMAPMFVAFRIFCAVKNYCIELRDDIMSNSQHFVSDLVLFYNLESKISTARRLSVNVEHISTGKLFTELKTKFQGKTEIYLSGADAKQLTSEIATNLMAAEVSDTEFIDQDNSPKLMNLVETALEMTTSSTKNFDAAKWNSVFWKDENARPDRVTYRLNEAYSKLDNQSQLQIKQVYERKDGSNTCFNLTGKYSSKDKDKGKDGNDDKKARQVELFEEDTASDPFHRLRYKREGTSTKDDYYDCGCPGVVIQCTCIFCGCNNVNTGTPTRITTTTIRTTPTTTTTTTTTTRAPRPTEPEVVTVPETEEPEAEGSTSKPKPPKTTKTPTNVTTTTEKPEKEKDQEKDMSGSLDACIPKSTESKDSRAQDDFNKFFEESKNFSEFQGEKFEVKTMDLKRVNLASMISRTSVESNSIRLSSANVVIKTNINVDDAGNVNPPGSMFGGAPTTEAGGNPAKDGIGKDVREAFFVRANFTSIGFHLKHAIHLCKIFDARLATPADMRQAWVNGADWCYIGHTYTANESKVTSMHPTRSCLSPDDDLVSEIYPPQVCVAEAKTVLASLVEETSPSLADDKESYINGVNCYGLKPQPTDEIYYSGIRLEVSDFKKGRRFFQTSQ